MNREEAIALAESWVRERYPAVPPIADAFEIVADPEMFDQLADYEKEAVLKNQGNWFVAFFCSWDTDELGMPLTLTVVVDHRTRNVGLDGTDDNT